MSRSTRRSLLKATGVAGVASMAGCVGSILGGGGESQLTQYADQVREQTAKYDGDRELAIKEGYTQVFGPLVPGQGFHFQNPEYAKQAAQSGEFDLEKPQILGYDTDGNLGYVEYGAPAGAVPEQPGLFSDVSEDFEWQIHQQGTHALSDGNDEVKPITEWSVDELMTPGVWAEIQPPNESIEVGQETEAEFGASRELDTRVVDFVTTHPDLRALHFWVHEENPNGLLSAVHPEFAQP